MQRSIAIVILCIVELVHTYRYRRHRIADEQELFVNLFPLKTPSCDLACFGQWKSDFQLTFQKNYDTDYFDVPLDDIILGSRQSLNSFCAITQQKFDCYTRECDMEKIEWSADRHICQDHILQFRENHGCLSKTAKVVRRDCTDVCNNIPIVISPQEKSYIVRHLSTREQQGFTEQNQNCHFISCHQMCHEQVIHNICEESERDMAREVVRHYYDSYLHKEWVDVREENEKLYSSFCRRVTAGQNENAFVSNMTRYNNQILERKKFEIKAMIASLP